MTFNLISGKLSQVSKTLQESKGNTGIPRVKTLNTCRYLDPYYKRSALYWLGAKRRGFKAIGQVKEGERAQSASHLS